MIDAEDTNGNANPEPVVAIDLFCGAGGLAYGLTKAGVPVKVGVDYDRSCKFALEKNTGAKFVCRDVATLSSSEINTWFRGTNIRILAGCAPCQPFSTYSQSRKTKDERWTLLREFKRLAVETQPEIITMENVPGLAGQAVWAEFTSALSALEYHVHWAEVACEDYGMPQTRKRLVLLASKFGPIKLLPADLFDRKTVRDVIGDLPPIGAGNSHADDPLHVSASLSSTNLRRITASKPGGTWRDWPEELRAACHLKDSGKSYPSVYGRMEWDRPAPTMTTQCYGYGNGRFGHPEQNRAISLREAALIQTFPKDYVFTDIGEKVSFSKIGTLIGNAVPPDLGKIIGLSILKHLELSGELN